MVNKIETALEHIGADILHVFQTVEPLAAAAEPVISDLSPSVSQLFDSILSIVSLGQATGQAAAAGQNTGAAKLAASLPVVKTVAESILAKFGIVVDDALATSLTNLAVAFANAIPAPVAK